ncbi:adenosylmethionine--8-amino-7-oxononanoate transaminase [soil metagenome]
MQIEPQNDRARDGRPGAATAADWVARDADVIWHGFTQMAAYADNSPIIVERAEGRELIDVDGRRYLDAISSLWVTTLGHHVPELDRALCDQAQLVAHSTLLGNGNRTAIEFAEALAQVVPFEHPHFLFASDGAAAVEQALKIAFQFWTNQGVSGRTTYLAFGGAYHGDTIGTLSVGAGGFGTDIFDPLRFDVIRAPGYDDPTCIAAACALIEAHRESLAAVIVEPLVQGAAGMQLRPAAEFAALGRACTANDVLLICDEVATGFGRTGTMFASEQCGLNPDLMTIGKGITGGYLAMAATVANDRVYDAFLGEDLSERTLYHGHSYSGNALAAAVGLAHLQLFEALDVLGNVVARSAQLAELLMTQVAPLPGVATVRQHGLMVGVELDPPIGAERWGRKVTAESVARGVLIRPLGDVVVLMPILTSTVDEIERIVSVLAESIIAVDLAESAGAGSAA